MIKKNIEAYIIKFQDVKHNMSITYGTKRKNIFMHINGYLPDVFTNIIYNLFYVVVKDIWER